MTEPVAGMSAMRPRDDEVGGLPMPKPPAERHFRRIKRNTQQVALWFALVLVFTGVFMFAPSAALMLAAAVAAIVGGVAQLVWRSRRYIAKTAEAIALLNSRRFDDAFTAFEDLARSGPTEIARALAVYHCGVVAARRGDVERALSLLGAVWSSHVHAGAAGAQLRQQVPLLISMLYTQVGDTNAAELWLAAANKLGKAPAFAHHKGEIVAEATLLARRAQYARAAELLAEHWRAIEETTPASLMRSTRLLRAFVLERAGASADDVEQLCAGCKPFEKGEYDSLGVSWPEVQAFLAARGFVS